MFFLHRMIKLVILSVGRHCDKCIIQKFMKEMKKNELDSGNNYTTQLFSIYKDLLANYTFSATPVHIIYDAKQFRLIVISELLMQMAKCLFPAVMKDKTS